MHQHFGKTALLALALMVLSDHWALAQMAADVNLKDNKEGLVDLCVNLIGKGEYVEAFLEFRKTQDTSQLALIVNRVYNGKVENFEQIVEFIKVLPETEKPLVLLGYEALHETMKAFDHLDNPKVLVLYDLVSKGGHSKLVGLVEKSRNNIMAQWTGDIGHHNYEQILSFYKKYPEAFNSHLRLLIETCYEVSTAGASRVLELITKLRRSSEKAAGYSYFYSLLKTKNELNSSLVVDLACFVRDDYDENGKDFESLKERLPVGIQVVIWSNYVRIESQAHLGYTLYGSNPGNIYTYPSDNYAGGRNQMWKVEREKMECSCYFRFNNIQNGGVLADGGVYAENEAPILEVGHKRDKQFWKTVPTGNGAYVMITDKAEGRWLDSGKLVSCSSSRMCCCSTVLMSTSKSGISTSWKIHS